MVIRKIDIRNFINEGFRFGMILDGALSVDGNDIASFKINSNYMTILSRHKTDGFLRYVKREIPLAWESRSYGNKDVHFVCPCCGKKTLVLYEIRKSMLCRKCRMLTHKSVCSQYELVPFNEM